MKLRYYLRGLGIGMLVTALILILSGSTGGKMSNEEIKRRAAALGMVEKDTSVLADAEKQEEPAEEETPEATQEKPEAEDVSKTSQEKPGAEDVSKTSQEKPEAEEALKATQEKPKTEEAPETAEKAVEKQEEKSSEPAPEAKKDAKQTQQDTQKSEVAQRADEVAGRAEEVAQEAPAAGSVVTFQVKSGDSSVAVARRAQEAGLVESAEEFDRFLCQNGYDKRISVGSYEIPKNATQKEIADKITKSTP